MPADLEDRAREIAGLAERCEQAIGPDRKLDAAIAVLLLPEFRELPDKFRLEVSVSACPAFSASLDAAMMLVGANSCTIQTDNEVQENHASCSYGGADGFCTAIATTPALALTAAALRARAALLQADQPA